MSKIYFNFDTDSFDDIEIVRSYDNKNCHIRRKNNHSYLYDGFILNENTKSLIVAEVKFYESSTSNQYIPRLTFRRTDKELENQTVSIKKDVIINLSDHKVPIRFWYMIHFLQSFKELVDTGEFENNFQVCSKTYQEAIGAMESIEKIKEISQLIKKSNFTHEDIKSLIYELRKKDLKRFLYLLKNTILPAGNTSREEYKTHFNVNGDEAMWHHFLKSNEWILGLNTNLQFIQDFIDEPKIGIPDSTGHGAPKPDIMGLSSYVTLIELKTSETPIFKKDKGSHSRTNTWEFSPDFISGISQCLGQKVKCEETFGCQVIYKEHVAINNNLYCFQDVKCIFIIGCRSKEFPLLDNSDCTQENIIKNNTFELFRRNNRNIEIITYDELFERAYHILIAKKLSKNWYSDPDFKI